MSVASRSQLGRMSVASRSHHGRMSVVPRSQLGRITIVPRLRLGCVSVAFRSPPSVAFRSQLHCPWSPPRLVSRRSQRSAIDVIDCSDVAGVATVCDGRDALGWVGDGWLMWEGSQWSDGFPRVDRRAQRCSLSRVVVPGRHYLRMGTSYGITSPNSRPDCLTELQTDDSRNIDKTVGTLIDSKTID